MSARRTVVIRADGNSLIGMGHIMRCIGLAQEMSNRGWNVVFALAQESEVVTRRLKHESFDYKVLGVDCATRDDLHATRALCRDQQAAVLIVDGYSFGSKWLGEVRNNKCCLMLWTDFLQCRDLAVDILLDQTALANERVYRAACPEGVLLCGLKYAVLRKEFLENPAVRRLRTRVQNILVTMGGADPAGATLKVMQAIPRIVQYAQVRVIVGAANRDLAEIKRQAGLIKGCEVLSAVQDMSAQLSWADLSISAAGTSLWECAYSGLPVLTTSIADNQLKLAEAVQQFGGGIDLGDIEDVRCQHIVEHITWLVSAPEELESMSRNMMKAVDGDGVKRVVDEVERYTGFISKVVG